MNRNALSLLRLTFVACWLACALTPGARAQDAKVSQEAINAAIDRGVSWLLNQQCRDGSWGENDKTQGGHRDSRNDLTAFCAYTLLKCKIPPEHPSIQRALLFLETDLPWTTYAIATQVMLLAELEDERFEERMPILVDRLLELQHDSHGTWGYPKHPSIQVDLSNTQYAALALRAARRSGHKVPAKVWSELAEGVLKHQEAPKDSHQPPPEGSLKAPQKAAFAYLFPKPEAPSFGYNVPNASMTTAGLTVLRIVEQELGSKYPSRLQKRADTAIELGLRWFDDHFSVTENTGGPASWIYYYLYGLQRMGALFETELIGGHEWYWEGAKELVKWQKEDGHWEKGAYQAWPRQPMPHGNTGYALLFLVKAMAPVTGGSTEKRGSYAAEDPRDEVHLRVSVRSQVTAWVSGFGDGVARDYQVDTPAGRGLFVKQVRYYVDGELAATVDGSLDKAWVDERFGGKLAMSRNGSFAVHVGVLVRSDDDPSGFLELVSSPLQVEVGGILEPWMLEHASFNAANVLRESDFKVEASSSEGKWTTPDRVADGLASSRWLSKAGDDLPLLRFEFRRATWLDTIVLCQADAHPGEIGRHARVTRIAYRINGKKVATEVAIEDQGLSPFAIRLPKRVRAREVEIQILEYVPGEEFEQEVGFSEVGFTHK